MSQEKDLLINHPGYFVEMDGRNMKIYVEDDGEHTIVFLSGWEREKGSKKLLPFF